MAEKETPAATARPGKLKLKDGKTTIQLSTPKLSGVTVTNESLNDPRTGARLVQALKKNGLFDQLVELA